jgi:putative membrane protein
MCLNIRRMLGVAFCLITCAAMAQAPGAGADEYSIIRPAFVQDPKVGISIPTQPKALLERFHRAHQLSIQFAKLALQKTKDPLIRSYAETIIQTHETGDEAILTDANRLNLTLMDPQAVNESENQVWTSQIDASSEMQSLQGQAFDHVFLANMLELQDMTVELAQGAARLKQFQTAIIAVTIRRLTPLFEQDRDRTYRLLGSAPSNLG